MQPEPIKEDDLYYTDAPIGEILRHVREHYNKTLKDVEKSLRIRAVQIDAIENSQYEKLPGRVYAIGFIRAYAEYLGLEPDRAVNMFKSQGAEKAKSPVLHFPVAASDGKLPSIKLLVTCGIILIAFIVGLTFWLQPTPSPLSTIEPLTGTITPSESPTPYGPFLPEY